MTSAETFDKFAQDLDAKQAAKGAAPVQEAAPAVEAPPVDATPKPAEAPAEVKAEPEAKTEPVKEEPNVEAKVETPKPTTEEPVRDDKGRFVKVAVHAREISKRDTEIATLREQLEKAQAKPTVKNIEALDKLKEKFAGEFPAEFQELIGAFSTELLTEREQREALQTRLDQFEQERNEAVEERAEFARTETQKAIDAVPTIGAWQTAAEAADATDQAKAIWDTAIEHDNFLRASPAWRDKPMTARFAEVERRTALDLGLEPSKVEVKAEVPPKVETPKADLPPKALPAAALPASLSNIPGPAASPNTPKVAAEGMSQHAANIATRGMTRQQAENFLLHGRTG